MSSHHCLSQFCWSLGGVKPKQVLHEVPQNAGEAGHSPHSSIPGKVNCLCLDLCSILTLSKCRLYVQDDTGEKKQFFPFCCWVILKFFILLGCWNFLSGLQSSPEVFLFMDSCLIVELHVRTEAGVSCSASLVMSLPKYISNNIPFRRETSDSSLTLKEKSIA